MTRSYYQELIERRRRQILVHSYIYYELNDNIISDRLWSKWAKELYLLQKDHPDIAKKCVFAKEFENFDYSTGSNLPFADVPWVEDIAKGVLDYHNDYILRRNLK